ncbi:MAG: hypothetical protein Q8K60_09135 [Parachlamydiaceae bacterium]|nr:hypothetical protein [Parachlamydiaceae bacterium]
MNNNISIKFDTSKNIPNFPKISHTNLNFASRDIPQIFNQENKEILKYDFENKYSKIDSLAASITKAEESSKRDKIIGLIRSACTLGTLAVPLLITGVVAVAIGGIPALIIGAALLVPALLIYEISSIINMTTAKSFRGNGHEANEGDLYGAFLVGVFLPIYEGFFKQSVLTKDLNELTKELVEKEKRLESFFKENNESLKAEIGVLINKLDKEIERNSNNELKFLELQSTTTNKVLLDLKNDLVNLEKTRAVYEKLENNRLEINANFEAN